MKTRWLPVIAVGAIAIASCASMQGRNQGETKDTEKSPSRTLGHPHDVVWSAAQEYMASRQWPLGETNRDKGYIRSGSFALPADRDYAHCRSGRRSSVTAYDAEFEIWLTRVSANGTAVAIATQISATGSGRGDCSSSGALEEELLDGIDSVITARRP